MSSLDKLLKNVDYSAFGYTEGLRIAKDAAVELDGLRNALAESRRLLQLADDANTMALQDSQIGAWSLSGELEKQITAFLHVPDKDLDNE